MMAEFSLFGELSLHRLNSLINSPEKCLACVFTLAPHLEHHINTNEHTCAEPEHIAHVAANAIMLKHCNSIARLMIILYLT